MQPQSKKVRTSKPPPRLAALVDRPGGLPRAVAIARGMEKLKGRRAEAREAILGLIGALDEMIVPPPTVAQLQNLRRVNDNLIALATLFEIDMLAETGKRLSGLLVAFAAAKEVHPEAIAVHVGALRLLSSSPDCETLAAGVLRELDRVLTHFGIPYMPSGNVPG